MSNTDDQQRDDQQGDPAQFAEPQPLYAPNDQRREVEVQEYAASEVRIRRAPKLPVFLITGGGIGAIVTFILTAIFPTDPQVGFGALFGYFSLYGVTGGVVIGALVAIVLDRRADRRATTVSAVRESAEIVEPEPTPEPDLAAEPEADLAPDSRPAPTVEPESPGAAGPVDPLSPR